MTTISCAMIVRDAEKTLEIALNSVACKFDELVIVDTGSVDQTRALAGRFTHTVHQFAWCDDFSAARQHAHDLCTSEWVFFLDADDEAMGAEHLRPLVHQAPDHIDAYMLRYVLDLDHNGRATTEFYRERLIRKSRMRWAGRVHEVMVPVNGGCAYERFEPTWVLHHGHGDAADSLDRNIRLLRLELTDKPDDTRIMFYLARDLVQIGQIKEGRRLLQRYMKTATWADEMYMAQTLIGHCYRVEGLYREAFDADVQLLYINPLWPGAYFQMAQDCYYLRQWDRSVHFSEIGQRLAPPITNLFVSPSAYTYDWMIFQVVALHQLGRTIEAADLTHRALQIKPTDEMHLLNQKFFFTQPELLCRLTSPMLSVTAQ